MTNEIGIYDVNTDELLLRCSDWTEAGRELADRGGPWLVVAGEDFRGDPQYQLYIGGTRFDEQSAVNCETVSEAEANLAYKADAEEDMMERLAKRSAKLLNGLWGAYARVIESAEVAA